MRSEILRLRQEHANFRKLLDLLEEQLDLFHRGESPSYRLMTDILHYMINYSDHFHHQREDAIFAYLAKRDPGTAQSVEGLARQHHVIAEAGTRLHGTLEDAINGALMPRQMIEAPGLLYVTYYRGHMEKEELELFGSVEQLLHDDDWVQLSAGVRREPDPLFGADVEARYCMLCGHISEMYGGVP
jgi:hemerythrin-like domain-containing protein